MRKLLTLIGFAFFAACSVPVSSFQGAVPPARQGEVISEIDRVMIGFPNVEKQGTGVYQGNHVMVHLDQRRGRLFVVSQYGRNDLLASRIATRLGGALRKFGVELRQEDYMQDAWH